MATQETSRTRITSLSRWLVVKSANIAFYGLAVLTLLTCIVAWDFSYTGGYYNYDVHWYSLRRNGKDATFSDRYGDFYFMDGEAVIQVGTNLWDGAPRFPWHPISASGGHVPFPEGFMLPQNAWHQFRYEIVTEPPDSLMHSLGDSHASIAFPFWSAIAVLLIPFLIQIVRRASRRVLERRRGFAPILKDQLDDTKPNVSRPSREHR